MRKLLNVLEYLLILAMLTALAYVALAIGGSNWDPMLWSQDLKEGIGIVVCFILIISGFIKGGLSEK